MQDLTANKQDSNEILKSPIIEEALQDDNSDFVKSVKNITVKQGMPITNPIPETAAGQQRFFYYEADEANLTVNSKDFDDVYEKNPGNSGLKTYGKPTQ